MNKKWLIGLILLVIVAFGLYKLSQSNLVGSQKLTSAVALATSTTCPAGTQIGDIDGNGKINVFDVQLFEINKASADFAKKYPCADIKGNGILTASEKQTLINCLASKNCSSIAPRQVSVATSPARLSSSSPAISAPRAVVTVNEIQVSRGHQVVVFASSSPVWKTASSSLTFTVNNRRTVPIFLSTNVSFALQTRISGGPGRTSYLNTIARPGHLAGDIAQSYIIPSGASRSFTYNYFFENFLNRNVSRSLTITQINYGLGQELGTGTGQNAQYRITAGLRALTVSVP